jgi:hypothetical protein
VLIHHAPSRTDREIADLAATLGDAGLPVSVGREGEWVDVHH